MLLCDCADLGTVTAVGLIRASSREQSGDHARCSDAPLIRFYLESDLNKVSPDKLVNVILCLAGKTLPALGPVDPVMVTLDGTPAVQAWAALEIPDGAEVTILSGMSAEVEVIAGEARDTLLVPVQALREIGPGQYAVFVVDDSGELTMRPVRVGLMDFANAQILEGLERGDVVSTGTVETE
jgi:multidrug efflux pump subunit AcrA (membrane-fusion protein)